MTPDEFRDLLALLGWTQGDAARILNRDFALVRRWASGKKAVPDEVAEALRRLAKEKGGD